MICSFMIGMSDINVAIQISIKSTFVLTLVAFVHFPVGLLLTAHPFRYKIEKKIASLQDALASASKNYVSLS